MEIITITNNKGGTAKTTTAQCLSIGLALKNKKVLLIDSDPQCNLSFTFKALNTPNNLYNLYTSKCGINECIYRVNINGANKTLDIIPSSKLLSNADNEFTKEPYTDLGTNKLLAYPISKIKNNYDYIIIDTPPNLGVLTTNALMCSTDIIVPMQADVFSIQGLSNLKNKVDIIKSREDLNPNLKIRGILLTKYSDRTLLNRDLKESILNATEQLNTKLFNTAIRESVAVRESQATNSCVLIDSPNNNASLDYMAFIEEFLRG